MARYYGYIIEERTHLPESRQKPDAEPWEWVRGRPDERRSLASAARYTVVLSHDYLRGNEDTDIQLIADAIYRAIRPSNICILRWAAIEIPDEIDNQLHVARRAMEGIEYPGVHTQEM